MNNSLLFLSKTAINFSIFNNVSPFSLKEFLQEETYYEKLLISFLIGSKNAYVGLSIKYLEITFLENLKVE